MKRILTFLGLMILLMAITHAEADTSFTGGLINCTDTSYEFCDIFNDNTWNTTLFNTVSNGKCTENGSSVGCLQNACTDNDCEFGMNQDNGFTFDNSTSNAVCEIAFNSSNDGVGRDMITDLTHNGIYQGASVVYDQDGLTMKSYDNSNVGTLSITENYVMQIYHNSSSPGQFYIDMYYRNNGSLIFSNNGTPTQSSTDQENTSFVIGILHWDGLSGGGTNYYDYWACWSGTPSDAPYITPVDITAPTYHTFGNNASASQEGEDVKWTITMEDDLLLGSYIFSNNDSGTFTNGSSTNLTGTSQVVTETITITASYPDEVCGRFYILDAVGNSTQTIDSCFNVDDTISPVVSISYPVNLYQLDGNVGYEIEVVGTSTDLNLNQEWIDNTNFTNSGSTASFTFENNTGIADAQYTLTVYVNDTKGNVGSDTITFTLDTVNPLPNLDTGNDFLADNTTVLAPGSLDLNYKVYDENLNNITAYLKNSTETIYTNEDDSPTSPEEALAVPLDTSAWSDGTYTFELTGYNHIPSHVVRRDFSFTLCTVDWTCDGYAACDVDNEQDCNSALDINVCGISYAGNYSEFTPLSCNYCTSTWDTTLGSCVLNSQTLTYDYSNTCCSDTGLGSDCNIPTNTTQACTLFDYGESGDIPSSFIDSLVKILAGIASIIPG